MKKLTFLFILLIFSSTLQILGQTSRQVPSQYPTIQAGLNSAQTGDTVLVQPGTYYENIVWPKVNGIKLISAGDSSNTIINGSGINCAMQIVSSSTIIDSNTIIQGFKLTNGGLVAKGGGIYLENASPVIKSCWITSNSATTDGSGIYVYGGKPKLISLNISYNSSNSNGGSGIELNNSSAFLDSLIISNNRNGGVYAVSSNYTLQNSQIINNIASNGKGGGIFSFLSHDNFVNLIVQNNSTSSSPGLGGGIYLLAGSTAFTNILVENNTGYYGGGICLQSGEYLKLNNNTIIKGNRASNDGGGIYNDASTLNIADSVKIILDQNTAYNNGGGIFINSSPSFTICSNLIIINNQAVTSGGGVFISNSQVSLNKAYVYNNTASNGPGAGIYITNSFDSVYNSTIIKNGSAGIYVNSGAPVISNSNILLNGSGVLNNSQNTNFAYATNDYWGDASGPNSPLNPDGLGDTSSLLVKVLPFAKQPPVILPVQNLQIVSSTSNSVTLSWGQSNLGNVKGFRVYWDTSTTSYNFKNSIYVNKDTSYTITGLITGLNYHIAVTSYDSTGYESWFSQNISATTTPPVLQMLTTQIAFPNTASGDSAVLPVKIVSANSSPLLISSLNNSLGVFKPSLTLPATVKGYDTLSLNIIFKPLLFGSYTDTLSIISNGGTAKVILQGQSPVPTLATSANNISFGTVERNTSAIKIIRIANSSVNKLVVDSVYTITPQFTVTPSRDTVKTGDSTSISIAFIPNNFGVFKDTLFLRNNSASSLIKIPLSGNSPFQVSFNTATLNFGNIAVGQTSSQSISIGNIFNSATTIDTIYTSTSEFSVTPGKAVLNSSDTLLLTIQFKPDLFQSFADSVVLLNKALSSAIIIKVYGNSPYPFIIADQSELGFDSVNVNSSSSKSIALKDSSLNALSIDSIYTSTKSFVASLAGGNKKIGSGESSNLNVVFKPGQSGVISDTVFVVNNSKVSPYRIFVKGTGVSIEGINENANQLPKNYAIYQNYPNPFNPSSKIRYALPFNSNVRIEIYNVLGQKVKELLNAQKNAGYYEVNFNTTGLASGVYLYMIYARSVDGKSEFRDTKKMMLLK